MERNRGDKWQGSIEHEPLDLNELPQEVVLRRLEAEITRLEEKAKKTNIVALATIFLGSAWMTGAVMYIFSLDPETASAMERASGVAAFLSIAGGALLGLNGTDLSRKASSLYGKAEKIKEEISRALLEQL